MGLFGCLTVVTQATSYIYEETLYEYISIRTFPRGRIVEFTNLEEFCHR